MSLHLLYEETFGHQNFVPDSEMDKVAASTYELCKEAEAFGRLMAREVVGINLQRVYGG